MTRTHRRFLQFVYYNFGGFAFFVSGYTVFSLLYGILHWHWIPAKILGDATGLTLNYLIQHNLAFRAETKRLSRRKELEKYIPFSIFNILLDYTIVGGLKAIGLTPFVGMWVSSMFFTVWNFLAYKFWIFRKKPAKKKRV